MYSKIEKQKWYKYILYAVCFWIIAGCLIYRAISRGNLALGGSDAFTQMYPAMLYISRTTREFISSLFSSEKFTFPMLEWSLGMGENTISTLNYYGLGDPFYLLSALVTEEYLPHFYTVFYYFRVFLGGVSSIAFFYELDDNRSNYAYVIGALVYSFSGFTFQSNIFIIFVHAMMYTPMLFLGVERTLKNKRKGLLTCAACLYALSGYFFLYVCSIALAVYVVYRLIVLRPGWKAAITKIIVMILEYLVGIALSAVIFIPSVVGFLSSNRANFWGLPFRILPLSDIKNLLINIFMPQYDNLQTMSVCAIAVICVVLALFEKNKHKERIGIILVFMSMIVPAVTTIMSGFGGYYDRWQIVLILYFAYITFIMWDELKNLSWLQIGVITIIYLILGLYGKYEGILDDSKYGHTILSYGLVLFFIYVITFCKKIDKTSLVRYVQWVLFLVVTFTIYRSWDMIARDMEINLVREEDVVEELIAEENNEFYRIDYEKSFGEPRFGMNISLMLDYPGISQYYSIENIHYINSFAEWETGKITHNNEGLDQRTILETASSVKYFILRSENGLLAPYGFQKIKTSQDGEWDLYENQYALPIAYVYQNVFDVEEYNNNMNGLQKQQVLLQAAAIEDYDGTLTMISEVDNHLYEGNYTIDDLQGGTIQDGMVTVEQGAVMEITTQLKADCENYLYFEDSNLNVTVNIGDECEKYREPITLGNVPKDMAKVIKITFGRPATFLLENMKFMYYDFCDYEKYISQMNDGSVRNIEVGTNYVNCNVTATEKKILCMAIPYEKGWHASIDGVETKIYRMNSMFMGIEVSEGNHTIEFSYVTPGIRIGLLISSITMLSIIIYYIVLGYRKRKFCLR